MVQRYSNAVPVSAGGTGATHASAARTNLGINEDGFGSNIIHNMCGLIAQRGTSIASPSSGALTLDRWMWINSTAAAVTISQDTDVPTVTQAGYRIPSSIKVDCTTAHTATGFDVAILRQNIEGYQVSQLVGGCVVQFWVKSPKSGTHYFSMVNGASDRIFGGTYEVNSADTWQKISITVPAINTLLGTWSIWNNALGMYLNWTMMVSTSRDGGTANVWEGYTTNLTVDPINLLDNVANNFFITDVRIIPGTEVDSSPPRGFQEELELCQRYFQKSYDYATAPGANTTTGLIRRAVMANSATSTANGGTSGLLFPVEMRTTPTVTIYTFDGVSGNLNYNKAGVAGAQAASTHTAWSKGLINVYTTAATGMTIGQAVEQAFHYVATAEI